MFDAPSSTFGRYARNGGMRDARRVRSQYARLTSDNRLKRPTVSFIYGVAVCASGRDVCVPGIER